MKQLCLSFFIIISQVQLESEDESLQRGLMKASALKVAVTFLLPAPVVMWLCDCDPVGNVYFMVVCGLILVGSSWLNFHDGLN